MLTFSQRLKVIILGYKATSETYIHKLKKLGIKIGDDVILYRPFNTTIDITAPHLLEIGNHVQITGPVTILTHDYSWCVLKHKYGEILGNQKKTIIGNNVFIGWGATILAGTIIGDNVVIGANSVVSGIIESNSVYAGNPAKKIMTIEEYYKKRKNKQIGEATEFVRLYIEKYKKEPPIELLKEYFPLFTNQSNYEMWNDRFLLMGNYEESINKIKESKSVFSNYEDFLSYVENEK